MELTTADPGADWAPSEIEWDFTQLSFLPRTVHEKLRWPNFQFGRAQAIINLPDAFRNAAQMPRKDQTAEQKGKAKGKGSGDEQDEGGGKEQLPSIVDWAGPECLPLDGEQNDGERSETAA